MATPRSANLSVRKTFTDQDKRDLKELAEKIGFRSSVIDNLKKPGVGIGGK